MQVDVLKLAEVFAKGLSKEARLHTTDVLIETLKNVFPDLERLTARMDGNNLRWRVMDSGTPELDIVLTSPREMEREIRSRVLQLFGITLPPTHHL